MFMGLRWEYTYSNQIDPNGLQNWHHIRDASLWMRRFRELSKPRRFFNASLSDHNGFHRNTFVGVYLTLPLSLLTTATWSTAKVKIGFQSVGCSTSLDFLHLERSKLTALRTLSALFLGSIQSNQMHCKWTLRNSAEAFIGCTISKLLWCIWA